jgi:hypothetical protein
MVGTIADEDVVGVDRIYSFSVAAAVKLLTPVVQVIWPTVNERSSATAAPYLAHHCRRNLVGSL